MNEDWVTIYVTSVLIIAAIPLAILMAWSIALCWVEIKQLQIERRQKYQENIRTIVGGTTKLISATTEACKTEDSTSKYADTSNTESFEITMMKNEYV